MYTKRLPVVFATFAVAAFPFPFAMQQADARNSRAVTAEVPSRTSRTYEDAVGGEAREATVVMGTVDMVDVITVTRSSMAVSLTPSASPRKLSSSRIPASTRSMIRF